MTIENSLAYTNGTLNDGTQNSNGDRNGYKLGGSDIKVNHIVRNNTSCRSGSGDKDKIVPTPDSSNQFWMGSNGSRCPSYSGALKWSFAPDGKLVVSFGGRTVTP